jgi:hypothetical protein
MTAPMMESASFHLRTANRLLMDGNTEAALDQINLAEIQLSLLNMDSQETSINQKANYQVSCQITGQVGRSSTSYCCRTYVH